jgi:hypothetical protein
LDLPVPQNLKKGQILIVKVPPFFDREYFYEVMGAGGKVIRASLYRSPKVKKHWTMEEYALLMEHGMIRLPDKDDMQRLAALDGAAGDSGESLDDLTGNVDIEV